MRLVLSVLIGLGGILPIVALVWGWLITRREYSQLVGDLDAIDLIIEAPEEDYPSGARDQAMREIREPTFNMGRLMYTYEWAQRLVLRQALTSLKGPAWLAIVGTVVGTTSEHFRSTSLRVKIVSG